MRMWLTGVMVLIALAACANDDPAPVASRDTARPAASYSPSSDAVLLEGTASGGDCEPSCGSDFTLRADGTWSHTDHSGTSHGKLGRTQVLSLRNLIEQEAAGLAALSKAKPQCPSRVDGVDVTYTFHARSGAVTVSNCTMDLSAPNRLLILTGQLRREINQRGGT